MISGFRKALEFGERGERVIRRELSKLGYFIVPTSFIRDPEVHFGGPRMINYETGEAFVLPDILALMNAHPKWVEVKTKRRDVHHNISGEDRQGCDQKHFCDYLRVTQESRIPGELAFLVLTPRPVLRIASLLLLNEHKRSSLPYPDGKRLYLWPIDIFRSYAVNDQDMKPIQSGWPEPTASYPWDRPAPTTPQTQEYFNFGPGQERQRAV